MLQTMPRSSGITGARTRLNVSVRQNSSAPPMNGDITCRLPLGNQAGFTLVELLFVISIVAVLASMLFGAIAVVKNAAQKSTCSSNMRQLGMGILAYAMDYDDLLPPCHITAGAAVPASWGAGSVPYFNYPFVGQYFETTETLRGLSIPDRRGGVLQCPADKRTFPSYNVSYGLNVRLSPEFTLGAWRTSRLSAISVKAATVISMESAHWRLVPGLLTPADCPVVDPDTVNQGGCTWVYGSAGSYYCWTPWHKGGANALFIDGHVSYIANPISDSLASVVRF